MRTLQSAMRGAGVLVVAIWIVGCAAIPNVPQKTFHDGQYHMLMEPIHYSVGDSGKVITVPAGFVHDIASIPRPACHLLSKSGPYNRAAIIHDYLYWAQPCTRKQADRLMLLGMKESEVQRSTANAIYLGVRAGGWHAWRQNRKKKAEGQVRIVPTEKWNWGPNETWEDGVQERLMASGYKDPPYPSAVDYCELGDSTDVPADPPEVPDAEVSSR